LVALSPEKPEAEPYWLLYLLFQINASPKFNHLTSRNGDSFAGAGVVALAFLAFFDDERTEAGQGELSVGGEGFLYGVEQGIQRLFSVAFADGGASGDFGDKFGLSHKAAPFCLKRQIAE
jgi:hypothetical protein